MWGMNLSVGIVGLPNVGKSTLFNALVRRAQAFVASYPFATIEPNLGVVPVPDERLDVLAEVVAKARVFSALNVGGKEVPLRVELPPKVPATVEFVDIAGLVAGAHKGEGLGNKFLANIREVDLIAHVVRDFEGSGVVTTGSEPAGDYETVTAELILKDLESLQNQKSNVPPKGRAGNARLKIVLDKLEAGFNEGRRARDFLDVEEAVEVADLFLLTMKPEMVVVNVGENELENSAYDDKKVGYAQLFGVKPEDIVVVSAKIESEIATLSDDEAKMFMDDLGVAESGLNRLIKTAYARLGLISFLTAPSSAKASEGQGGVYEVRAWTIRKGTTAVTASGVIHTDFMDKFIKAEIVPFADFVEVGGWKKCRELGKVRLEGRDYIMQDGDVVDFKIGG